MKPAVLSLLFVAALAGCASGPPVGSSLREDGWHALPLPGKAQTRYALDERAGRPGAIRAEADASASMLRRPARIAPDALGRVRFSWRVAELIAEADLSDRDAADSPVRVVFAFDGDHGRLSPRNRMLFDLAQAVGGERPPYATLMYVWDNRAAPETVIPGGRTDRVRKIVVESGPAQRGQWRDYERHLADDFRRAFGEEPGPLIAVGIMTDADNTRSRATAWYGAIELLSAPAIASR
jgi:hypothetical protein